MKFMPTYNPSNSLIKSILAYQKHASSNSVFGLLLKKIASLKYRFWSVITASDIHKLASITADLQLPHPNGVVIHQDVVIGNGCMLMQQVTIGQLADGKVPVIGNGVYVGAGAKLLGGIEVSDNAVIGANAVVLIDVPAGRTAVGVPAKLLNN